MKTTLLIYIVMGFSFVAPLIGFNIRKIFVKKPPAKMKINIPRLVVIAFISAFLIVFLVMAFNATLSLRHEFIAEEVATEHAYAMMGKKSYDDFLSFLNENKSSKAEDFTENVNKVRGNVFNLSEITFQISDEVKPNVWERKDSYDKTDVVSENNPLYVFYRVKTTEDDERLYFIVRLRQEEGVWKVEAFDVATKEQLSDFSRPTEKNGKWYKVKG